MIVFPKGDQKIPLQPHFRQNTRIIPVPETFKAFTPMLTQRFGVKFGLNFYIGVRFAVNNGIHFFCVNIGVKALKVSGTAHRNVPGL